MLFSFHNSALMMKYSNTLIRSWMDLHTSYEIHSLPFFFFFFLISYNHRGTCHSHQTSSSYPMEFWFLYLSGVRLITTYHFLFPSLDHQSKFKDCSASSRHRLIKTPIPSEFQPLDPTRLVDRSLSVTHSSVSQSNLFFKLESSLAHSFQHQRLLLLSTRLISFKTTCLSS